LTKIVIARKSRCFSRDDVAIPACRQAGRYQ